MNHAILRLDEELRVLRDTYRGLLVDESGREFSAVERQQIMAQLNREIGEVRHALILLGRERDAALRAAGKARAP